MFRLSIGSLQCHISCNFPVILLCDISQERGDGQDVTSCIWEVINANCFSETIIGIGWEEID